MMIKRFLSIIVGLTIIVSMSSCTFYEDIDYFPDDSFFDEDINESEFQSANVERVVDGDTIIVIIDGESYRVRLIGIDTPESVAPANYLEKSGKENTEEGAAASDYTKNLLSEVDTVYLQKDVSDTDEYGRLLRYVWLELPTDCMDIQEVEDKMLNGILIRDGIADVEIYQPDSLYESIFKEIDKE